MRIAITGGTGNVGSALLRALIPEDEIDEIVVLARRVPTIELAKVRWVAADVRDSDLRTLLTGVERVVHLAWQIQPARDRDATHAVNVEGTRRVLDAAAHAGVRTVVHASSVGAYAPGPPPPETVDESWPTTGVSTSFYARDKAAAEALLRSFADEHPQVRTACLRPAPIVQRAAAEELRRYFFGPFFPNRLVGARRTPIAPVPRGLWFQVVHADDVADAYRRVLLDDEAHGPYNVAADPPIGPRRLARHLGGLPLPLPARVVRAAAAVSWRARLQPSPPGWVDLAYQSPLMDTARLWRLGWSPRHSGPEALDIALAGFHDGSGGETPPLDADAGGPLRLGELRTGVGADDGIG
ncbi:NAD-dependent epimerase/dehydratase family protein [Patulibacter defluvii]|uniref:NAD-dependent epimerase/dehydratase family protein n=1 Tax=Patulibacter defluvii TaxID=3095358 RepID=UPI002A748F8D|nr:NAD-dependent epimerase/dehydratase family protein [Patulibacter sp. DM4]